MQKEFDITRLVQLIPSMVNNMTVPCLTFVVQVACGYSPCVALNRSVNSELGSREPGFRYNDVIHSCSRHCDAISSYGIDAMRLNLGMKDLASY